MKWLLQALKVPHGQSLPPNWAGQAIIGWGEYRIDSGRDAFMLQPVKAVLRCQNEKKRNDILGLHGIKTLKSHSDASPEEAMAFPYLYQIPVFQFEALTVFSKRSQGPLMKRGSLQEPLTYEECGLADASYHVKRAVREAVKSVYALGLDYGLVTVGVPPSGHTLIVDVQPSPVLDHRLAELFAGAIERYDAELARSRHLQQPVMLGADPEFLLLSARGKAVPASRYVEREGIVGCDGIVNSGWHRQLGEQRQDGHDLQQGRPQPHMLQSGQQLQHGAQRQDLQGQQQSRERPSGQWQLQSGEQPREQPQPHVRPSWQQDVQGQLLQPLEQHSGQLHPREQQVYPLAELRPQPSPSPRELARHLEQALQLAAQKFSDPSLRWVAGGMPLKGLPLGGHVHFSGVLLHTPLVRALDNYLALPLLLAESEQSIGRRPRYGALGAVRRQPHGGFEYRTLASWLASPVLARGVFALSKLIAEHYPLLKRRPLDDPSVQARYYRGDKQRLRRTVVLLWLDLERLPAYLEYLSELKSLKERLFSLEPWDEQADFRKLWAIPLPSSVPLTR